MTLAEYKIENGVTVNLVKAQANTAEASANVSATASVNAPGTGIGGNPFAGLGQMPPGFAGMPGGPGMGGMPDPNQLASMMNNPMVQ